MSFHCIRSALSRKELHLYPAPVMLSLSLPSVLAADDCVTQRQPKSCSLTLLFRRTRRDIWFLLQKPAKLQLICCVRVFYPDCHIQDALRHLTTLTHIQTLMHAFLYTLFYLWLSSVALSFDSWMLHTAWSVIVNCFLTYSSVAFLQFVTAIVTIINQ